VNIYEVEIPIVFVRRVEALTPEDAIRSAVQDFIHAHAGDDGTCEIDSESATRVYVIKDEEGGHGDNVSN